MGRGATRRGRQSGQIIALAPILILLMLASVLLAVNVSMVARERIKLQVSSDAAARDGAFTLAKALSSIAALNDLILAADAEITLGLANIAAGIASLPEGAALIAEGWELVEEGRETGLELRETQESIIEATPAAVEAAVFTAARANGNYFATFVPGLSHTQLDLKDDPLYVWPFVKPRMRARAEIQEKVVVGLRKGSAGPVFGDDLLRGLGGGRSLEYPSMSALSAGVPYWKSRPREKTAPVRSSMLEGGLGWNAKLESTWEHHEAGARE